MNHKKVKKLVSWKKPHSRICEKKFKSPTTFSLALPFLKIEIYIEQHSNQLLSSVRASNRKNDRTVGQRGVHEPSK